MSTDNESLKYRKHAQIDTESIWMVLNYSSNILYVAGNGWQINISCIASRRLDVATVYGLRNLLDEVWY